ncbi:hypothetical protein, partial [Burkholderia glumae]|uniref:hypothetical protein n=1 Tax=Burkholderia glumae TaxID=337 RepID=UPI0020368D1A
HVGAGAVHLEDRRAGVDGNAFQRIAKGSHGRFKLPGEVNRDAGGRAGTSWPGVSGRRRGASRASWVRTVVVRRGELALAPPTRIVPVAAADFPTLLTTAACTGTARRGAARQFEAGVGDLAGDRRKRPGAAPDAPPGRKQNERGCATSGAGAILILPPRGIHRVAPSSDET